MRTIESRMADQAFVAALPKNRAEARAANKNIYYTGKCKHGHYSYRHTSSGTCSKCASLATVRQIESADPEVIKRYREKANNNWKASGKRKALDASRIKDNPIRSWISCIVGAAKSRAKRKGVEFNITHEFIYSILPENCPIFGAPFIFSGNKKVGPESPSLDRINPKLGYVIGNIAVISVKANMIKSSANAEEIQKVADWLKLQETKI